VKWTGNTVHSRYVFIRVVPAVKPQKLLRQSVHQSVTVRVSVTVTVGLIPPWNRTMRKRIIEAEEHKTIVAILRDKICPDWRKFTIAFDSRGGFYISHNGTDWH
jgi:hypothetical protein